MSGYDSLGPWGRMTVDSFKELNQEQQKEVLALLKEWVSTGSVDTDIRDTIDVMLAQ